MEWRSASPLYEAFCMVPLETLNTCGYLKLNLRGALGNTYLLTTFSKAP